MEKDRRGAEGLAEELDLALREVIFTCSKWNKDLTFSNINSTSVHLIGLWRVGDI